MLLDNKGRCLNCGLKHNQKVKDINKRMGQVCVGCLIQYLKQYHSSKQIAEFTKLELGEVNKCWFIVKRDDNLNLD